MGKFKEAIEKIKDECTKIYSEKGAQAVGEHVINRQIEQDPMYKDVKYKQCIPCDAGMPVLDGVCLVCGSNVHPELGRKVRTIGEIRALISNLNNKDIAVIEACDKDGEVEDLYPMYIDVIEGIERNGIIVNEVRFCQMPNTKPEYNEIKTVWLYNETKTVWVCQDCGSDNVQFKTWTDANTMTATNEECPIEDGDCNCKDCESTSLLKQVEMMPRSKVIGFQVVGEEQYPNEGELHPDMDNGSCIYNLEQTIKMIVNNKDPWRLKAIWSGDIEKPTLMFEGDLRK